MDYRSRAAHIKLLIFDVDGVLTDGTLPVGPEGEVMKVFYCHDGLGISLAHKAGLRTAIITARQSPMVSWRGEELKIQDVYQGAADKAEALTALADKHKLDLQEIAYVGDDINDLPVLTRVGLGCAPANAVAEVKKRAHYVATHSGGQGAVREIIEMILKAQGKWEALVATYVATGNEVMTQ
ncbi:hypothetical protein P22_0592 [Propionispora sp. 2/2-37]|uniref:KdsC family phosphatase n=1 Tax=Propionispora sp. 2/2-37 TaxID=1677858 RepID=UPI0006BB7E2A|nr:HAD hydrolase family protein [Propionispora sp. 2/2-37]CUH94526.1 hypothetical protein P22_0592 [Propionispora sp. 2/2-37]